MDRYEGFITMFIDREKDQSAYDWCRSLNRREWYRYSSAFSRYQGGRVCYGFVDLNIAAEFKLRFG